jgi:prepilin-type processing-associated H-X9-DG protein
MAFGTPTLKASSLYWANTTDDQGAAPSDAHYMGAQAGAGGIFFSYSMVSIDMIKDGTSNTLAVGEKFMCPDYYATGSSHGDDWCCWIGYDCDIGRAVTSCSNNTRGTCQPMRDVAGVGVGGGSMNFGSVHAGGFNVALCDGSVRQISYGIDSVSWYNLGNRADGNVIDVNNLNY